LLLFLSLEASIKTSLEHWEFYGLLNVEHLREMREKLLNVLGFAIEAS
jgi:hypothetical protein